MRNGRVYRSCWALALAALPAYAADAAPRYKFHEVGGLGGGLSVFFNWDYTGGNFTTTPSSQKSVIIRPAGGSQSPNALTTPIGAVSSSILVNQRA